MGLTLGLYGLNNKTHGLINWHAHGPVLCSARPRATLMNLAGPGDFRHIESPSPNSAHTVCTDARLVEEEAIGLAKSFDDCFFSLDTYVAH